MRGTCLWEEASPSKESRLLSGTLAPKESDVSDARHSRADSNFAASASSGAVTSLAELERKSQTNPKARSTAGSTKSSSPSGNLDEWVAHHIPPSIEGTASIIYLGKVHIPFRPLAAVAISPPASAQVLLELVKAIESGEAMQASLQQYRECEILACGFLTAREIPVLIAAVFEKYGLKPPSDKVVEWIYNLFDPDHSLYLNARECLCLAEALLRTVCISGEISCARDGQVSAYSAEDWAATYTAPPMAGTERISYLGALAITFADFSRELESVASLNSMHYQRACHIVETGTLVRAALEVFKECDCDRRGSLSWDDDSIYNFVARVFKNAEFDSPTKAQISPLFQAFDRDKSSYLGSSECLCLVDSLVRSMFCSRTFKPMHAPTQNASAQGDEAKICQQPLLAKCVVEAPAAGNLVPPPVGTPSIVYLDGLVEVDFVRLAMVFAPLAQTSIKEDSESHFRIIRSLEDGSAAELAWQIYQSCDKKQNGSLDWINNEIQEFVVALFHQNGFHVPSEEQIYHLYTLFDVDRNLHLSARACMCLADAALRAAILAHLTNSGKTSPAKASENTVQETRAAGDPNSEVGDCRSPRSPLAKASPRKVSFDPRHESLLLELSDPTEPSEQSPISLITPGESSSPDTSAEQPVPCTSADAIVKPAATPQLAPRPPVPRLELRSAPLCRGDDAKDASATVVDYTTGAKAPAG
jgi:hypothetical protein